MSGHRTCSAINLTSNASRCFFDVDIFMILMHAFALMRIYSGILLKSDFCMPLLSIDARAIAVKRPPLCNHQCAFASICFTSARFHCAPQNAVCTEIMTAFCLFVVGGNATRVLWGSWFGLATSRLVAVRPWRSQFDLLFSQCFS